MYKKVFKCDIKTKMKKIILLAAVFLFGVSWIPVFAMSSTNYKISADSINSGGSLGSSANYKSLDSIGEGFTGSGASANFKTNLGFEPMLQQNSSSTSLTFSLDSSTKNIGSITTGTPINSTTTASVTTDAVGGYDLYVAENNDLKHTDGATTIAPYSCTIAAPCAWSGTGFGFSLNSGTSIESKWGTNPNNNYAAFPTTSTLIHTKAGFASGVDTTVIGYKLDVPLSQKSGNYTNILTYTVITKL